MKRNLVLELISSLLIILFIYAAVSKLLEYETFKVQLSKSPFITQFAGIVSWALPIGEILVGFALASKRTRLFGLYSSLFLMTMFTAYIYAMLNYSYYVPCSCGGILSKMGWTTHLWFNAAFVALSIAGILLQVSMDRKQSRLPVTKVEELPPVVYTAMS
jgi:Methylamine utilisation protein MauE